MLTLTQAFFSRLMTWLKVLKATVLYHVRCKSHVYLMNRYYI